MQPHIIANTIGQLFYGIKLYISLNTSGHIQICCLTVKTVMSTFKISMTVITVINVQMTYECFCMIFQQINKLDMIIRSQKHTTSLNEALNTLRYT